MGRLEGIVTRLSTVCVCTHVRTSALEHTHVLTLITLAGVMRSMPMTCVLGTRCCCGSIDSP